jgi:hypothetical protein
MGIRVKLHIKGGIEAIKIYEIARRAIPGLGGAPFDFVA